MLRYETIPVTPFQQNCSLIWCDRPREAAVVDPGGEIERISAAARRQGVRIAQILLTHAHIDHAGGAGLLSRLLGVPIVGPHTGDQFWIDGLTQQARMFGVAQAEAFAPTRWLADGDTVQVGEVRYIADPDSLDWAWEWMEQLYQTGRVDVQSHGYSGQLYITSLTPEEMIRKEIFESTPVLAEHFHQRPRPFIWPGGNFTPLAVQIARQGGYKLGFTAYSRGPVMFNWIPLGEEELQVNDPLMVLPRAWSNSANVNLDQAVSISKQAYEEAIRDYPFESEWYRTYCGGELPSLDSIQSATWPK